MLSDFKYNRQADEIQWSSKIPHSIGQVADLWRSQINDFRDHSTLYPGTTPSTWYGDAANVETGDMKGASVDVSFTVDPDFPQSGKDENGESSLLDTATIIFRNTKPFTIKIVKPLVLSNNRGVIQPSTVTATRKQEEHTLNADEFSLPSNADEWSLPPKERKANRALVGEGYSTYYLWPSFKQDGKDYFVATTNYDTTRLYSVLEVTADGSVVSVENFNVPGNLFSNQFQKVFSISDGNHYISGAGLHNYGAVVEGTAKVFLNGELITLSDMIYSPNDFQEKMLAPLQVGDGKDCIAHVAKNLWGTLPTINSNLFFTVTTRLQRIKVVIGEGGYLLRKV